MKKTFMFLLCTVMALTVLARPGFGPGPRHGFGGPRPAPMHHHHHHHRGWVGPAIVGGVIGGAILGSVISRPTVQVVTPIQSVQPVAPNVVYQQVWVPDTWVDQVQVNGTVIKVLVPGHYETRQVVYP